ncbi:hypothetical protein Clacol_000312 [Clathrus columnatus]|uniref:ML-like domain-containing protein n=1 Tax=Clathrus columnatus TaxID=1419009 RepID=A0AAV4ZY94_9AGAM|nr:hypothetical protein Clacol_000312 [Clathrus columnatus]
MTFFFAWSRTLVLLSLTQFFLCHTVFGDKVDSLFTSSVTYCAPPEAILIDEFSIVYFAANQTVSFNISAASVVPNLRVTANIFLNVYGMRPINITEDFCTILGNAICPLPTYNFTGSATIPLPSSLDVASRVPQIAYKIPDLEAFAQLTLTDINTGDVAACIQATLSNGWSTRQPAVAYTTGGFAIFALISSLLHSLLPSTPFAPSPTYSFLSIAPTRFVDYILLSQQIALTGFLHLNFPLVYRAFVTNFAWSLGLFPDSQPIQRAIDHMRHLTGSKLSDGVQNPIAFVNRALSPYNEVPGVLASSALALAEDMGTKLLIGRDGTDSSAGQGPPATVTNNDQDILSAGIPVYVNSLSIGTANAFMSVFFTVLIGAVVGAVILGIMYLVLTFLTTRLKGNKWAWTDVLHAEFRWFAVSNSIRYALIILYPVLVLTFFEWTLHDSWLVILLSVILLMALGGAILYPTIQTILISRRSSSELLYTLPSLVRTYGAFYIAYKPPRYYVFIILLAAAVLKSIFIGFAQSSGLTQVTAIFIIEFAVLILICLPRPPFRSRRGDILGIYLAVTRVVGVTLMFPFVEKFGIKPIPRVAVGFVLIVLFSIAVIVLTFNVVFNFGKGLLWMRHGDEHLRSSTGSTSSSSDIEKQSNSNSQNQEDGAAEGMKQRPSNPTPTTTFSQEHDRNPPPHSRHTPNMDAAVSPGFTIPSVYSSEDGDLDSIAFRSALPSPSPYPTTPRSSAQSAYTSSSTPSTAKSSRFSHRRYESSSDNHHQRRLSTHEEDVADIPSEIL